MGTSANTRPGDGRTRQHSGVLRDVVGNVNEAAGCEYAPSSKMSPCRWRIPNRTRHDARTNWMNSFGFHACSFRKQQGHDGVNQTTVPTSQVPHMRRAYHLTPPSACDRAHDSAAASD